MKQSCGNSTTRNNLSPDYFRATPTFGKKDTRFSN